MNKALHTLLISFLLSLLAACGGGDSDGGNNNTGDVADVETVSAVAIETAKNAINANGSDFGEIFSFNANPQNMNQKATNKPTEEYSETSPGTCGGNFELSMTITTPDAENQVYPLTMDGQADFNNYCIDIESFQITYNGLVMYEADFIENSLSIWMNYDLSYSSDHPEIASGSISATESCSGSDAENLTCSFSSDYTYGGESYSLSDVTVSSDGSGFSISGELEDEDGNTYDITASDLSFCDNGNFASGEINITMGGETATVTFPSCNQYSVAYLGETETFDYD